jgi:outer membrane protein
MLPEFISVLFEGTAMTKVFKLLISFVGLALIAMPVQAYDKGDWIFRAGAGSVNPKSTAYSNSDDDIIVEVDSATAVTLTGVYFMSPNWSFEVLLASPFKHDVLLGATDVPATKIGEVQQLPPTFTFQYHFMPESTFRPYVGLGLNYTTFFSEELVSELSDAGLGLAVDDSFGVAVQVATDIALSDKWLLNFDVRWIQIEADATLSGEGLEPATIPLDISPLVYSINIGYAF